MQFYLKSILRIVTIALLVSLMACGEQEQGRSITGSENIVMEVRSLGEFEEISVSGIAEVDIREGDEQQVIVRSNDNFIQYVVTEESGGVLFISTDFEGSANDVTVEISIIIPRLSVLETNGVSAIHINGFRSLSQLKIVSSGVSAIYNEDGYARELNLQMSGTGAYHGFDFVSRVCEVTLTGVGSVEVTVEEALGGRLSGIGDISYKGQPVITVDRSGLGNVIDAN